MIVNSAVISKRSQVRRWSLHVLPVSACFFFRFLLLTVQKDVLKSNSDSELTLGVGVRVNCVSKKPPSEWPSI